MERVIDLLAEQPLLLLFVVAALGYAIGEIKIKGTGLGVAAVLFVGLAFGALDERLTLPPALVSLGLVLFVYMVGLASGPGFFASFLAQRAARQPHGDRRAGGGGIDRHGGALFFGFKPSISAGIYTGALTNTPALAQVTNFILTTAPPDIAKAASSRAGRRLLGQLSDGRHRSHACDLHHARHVEDQL